MGSPWSAAQLLLTYAGDTVIDGFAAQEIERVFQLTQNFGTDTLVQSNWGSGFTRTNGDVVWEWNGSAWDTLYWFSAEPGDEWQPFWAFGEVCPDHVIHVLDTSTVVVDGVPLRSLVLEMREAGTSMGWWFNMTERIGGFGGFLFPGLPPCGGIYECFCSILCYRDDQINADNGCSLPVTLGMHDPIDAGDAHALNAYPDPGDDLVCIEITGTQGPWTLTVLSLAGEVVLRSSGTGSAAQVNTSGLAPGSYVLHVTAGHKESFHRRWTKR